MIFVLVCLILMIGFGALADLTYTDEPTKYWWVSGTMVTLAYMMLVLAAGYSLYWLLSHL